jgi:hypothetical protein
MDECHICLEPLNVYIVKLSCGHKFHYNCVQEWIKKTKKINKPCVICEKDTEIIDIINEYIEDKVGCCNIL